MTGWFELEIENTVNEDLPASKQAKHLKQCAKCATKQLSESWSLKPLHGKYPL